MELSTYSAEAEIEASHWWFIGRRKLFSQILNDWQTGADAKILDVGTSTGTNLRMLRDLGYRNYQGLDLSD